MPLPQDYTSGAATDVARPGASHDGVFPRLTGATGAGLIIESLGHMSGVFGTVSRGASAPTVKLQGSMDRINWTDIATNAHAGNDAKEAVFVDKPYRFFRANKTVDAADPVDYYLRLTGMGGGA